MTAQLSLFATPAARASDPSTSQQAADVIANAGGVEAEILDLFHRLANTYAAGWAKGLTDDEIVNCLDGRYHATVKSARSRLSKRGLLVPCGERPSRRGRPMTAWTLP